MKSGKSENATTSCQIKHLNITSTSNY